MANNKFLSIMEPISWSDKISEHINKPSLLCFFVSNVINSYISSYVENISESEDVDENTSVQIKPSRRPHRMLDI